jgi:hypothetical protein
MVAICRTWDWEHLDTMAFGLINAIDLTHKSFRTDLRACKLREATDPGRTDIVRANGTTRHAPSQDKEIVNNELARLAMFSQQNMQAAVEHIKQFFSVATQYMTRNRTTGRIYNVGEIVVNVLARVDMVALHNETGFTLPTEIPVTRVQRNIIPPMTHIWKSPTKVYKPVSRNDEPVRHGDLLEAPVTASASLKRSCPSITPGHAIATPSTSVPQHQSVDTDMPKRKKTRRGGRRGNNRNRKH